MSTCVCMYAHVLLVIPQWDLTLLFLCIFTTVYFLTPAFKGSICYCRIMPKCSNLNLLTKVSNTQEAFLHFRKAYL